MSSFGSISTALTALQAHRRALDVTGNNIANANTAGYTRQRAELTSRVAPGVQSLHAASRLTGNGVEVTGTSRLGDAFLDARVRSQTSLSAELTGRAQTLAAVEDLMAEPGEQGLGAQLQKMWAAWSDVAAHPEQDSARRVVLQTSQAVVDRIRSGHAAVASLWGQQRDQAGATVTEVNETAASVADLNEQVRAAVTNGGSANELMDQRDQLVTRLVELTGASVLAGRDGVVDVYLGGSALVRGTTADAVVLTAPTQMSGVDASATPPAVAGFAWASGGAATVSGGSLKASVDALNTVLPGAAGEYDRVARALAGRVNAVHEQGRGPNDPDAPALRPFLSPSPSTAVTAENLRLAVTSPGELAAAVPGQGAQDGKNAAAIARVGVALDGPDAVWRASVVATGVDVQAAQRRADVAQQSMAAAVGDQVSAAGVSLDEETANLLVIQRAYEGAARVLTAVDQALDTLINRTGLVGR
ncbi:flagellar hook-associated protein FlgK [Quadrisphaera sp. DSM 44207]|uniref:flagellar hook-associated protein FlgK n=1 Tax=Quadrisphaera sp. DSM 44207 TaxID=1881057 RepID=UPI00087F61DE|nr:flagellar hook-associated protein FlgK [Quadrisphaera sp. DSM 44207]SDQ20443.1 flagellar hook-associated protein 1 FlgK [Quadrisphaera sp. DSM 44207]